MKYTSNSYRFAVISPHIKFVRGCIVYVISSIHLSVRLSVCLFINLTSKFCVKHVIIAHISVTTYQIFFRFGLLPLITAF